MADRDPNQPGDPTDPRATGPPVDPDGDSDREAHNRSLLRRYVVDVLGAGRMDVVDEIFHEEVEMDTRDGRTITGQDQVREYLTAVRDRFSDLETEVDTIMATETEALAKFDVTAVHDEDYFGVDPTNREVTFRVFSRATIEDGKMITQGDLVNPLRMQPPSKRHGQFAVLEQIEDGVVVVDRDEAVVEINPRATELLDVPDREVLNEPIQDLIAGEVDLPAVGSAREIALDDGQRIVDVSASPLTDLQDNRIGRIFVLHDVTQRVRRRQQLEALSRHNEHLDQFVSVISHDLRNPLATARARVQLARETGEQRHFEDVEQAHDRIETIIEELLSLSKAGMTIEETESISLATLAETAWATADTEGTTLQTAVSPDWTIDGDPNLVRHVFENLFRNAADHNSPPVTVTVGSLEGTSQRGFFVEDNGEGIPPGDRETIFEYGYTTSEEGTGYGLAIVSEFVEAHGWEITLTEGDDGGARFEIFLDQPSDPA